MSGAKSGVGVWMKRRGGESECEGGREGESYGAGLELVCAEGHVVVVVVVVVVRLDWVGRVA